MKETDQVLTLMFEMGRMIRHACIGAGELPIPLAHLETLRFVDERKNPTMREIAGYLRITAPSTTSIIDDLVQQKYLSRATDAKDRRIVRLMLSAKGKKFLTKSMQIKMKILHSLVRTLNPADQRELARILLKLTK